MINWIVSFETFIVATTQVSRFLKWPANQIVENNESTNQCKANVPSQHLGVSWHDSRIALWSPFSENARVFSEIATFFSKFLRH